MWRNLLGALRRRVLDLRGLPRAVQVLALLSLTSALLAGLALLDVGDAYVHVAKGTSPPAWRTWLLDVFGVDFFVSGRGVAFQFWIVTALVYVGLAVGSATLAYGALRPGWRAPRLTLVYIGLVAAVCAALHKTIADRLDDFPPDATTGSLSGGLLRYRIAGWIGFAIALALLATPLRLLRRAPAVTAAAAAAPFVLGLLAWATSGDGGIESPSLGGVQRLKGLGAGVAFQTVDAAVMVLSLLLLWGVVEAVRASRDAAVAAEGLLPLSASAALLPLLAAKLAWVAVGLGGALPDALGGSSPIWSHSRSDGAASWLLAAAFGATFLALLLRPARLRERLTSVAGLVAIGILVAGSVVEFLTDAIDTSLRAWWDRERYPGLGWFLEFWEDYEISATIALLALAAPAGLLLVRRSRTVGLFLLLVGAWSLPRAIGVAIDLSNRSETRLVGDANFIEKGNRLAWVDLVSLDVAVTLAIAAAAALWWRGRQRWVPPRALVFALVATTVATYTAQLAPASFRVGHLFYLGIVFPVVYQFLFDADALNERDGTRAVRVLAVTGLAAVSVAAALNGVSTSFLDPQRPSATNLGLSIYKGPLLLVVVLASIPLLTRRRGRA